MFNILLVDDEDSMRFVLRKALEKIPHINIVGEAKQGDEAVALVASLKPDAIFMDVDMPSLNGVEAAKLIVDIHPSSMIVFLTGHNEYMQEAFELYAFDYILKPFKLDRLKATVERMQAINPQNIIHDEHTKSLPTEKLTKEIFLKNKDGMAVISSEDIVLVQRENRNTIIITPTDRFITSQTLSELETKLPPHLFLRSHKSYIIQIGKITRISPYGRWTYVVKLKGITEDALLTKANAVALEERFEIKIGS